MSAGILLSLESFEDEFSKMKADDEVCTAYTELDLYLKLCVLSSQQWVPVSVLGRMWGLDATFGCEIALLLSEMSLLKLWSRSIEDEGVKKPGIMMHDLHLEFCKRRCGKMSKTWHCRMLDGHLDGENEVSKDESMADSEMKKILAWKPGGRWSAEVDNEMYIQRNVARHLRNAGMHMELASLLLEFQWLLKRCQVGGILGVESDFDYLVRNECQEQRRINDVQQQVRYVLKAVRLSFGRLGDGPRAFLFELYARLLEVSKSGEVIPEFLKRALAWIPKPCLVPSNMFFPNLNSAMVAEIPVGGNYWSVALSPCGRYIAAAAGNDIVVVGFISTDVLGRPQGPAKMLCMSFCKGSSEIVSGCSLLETC